MRFLSRLVADPDVAIDLGTVNTRVYALGRGLVADEPTIVSPHDTSTGNVPEGRSLARDVDPAIRPLDGGAVRDVDAAGSLLRRLLRRARRFGLIKPNALVCAPSDASREERSALVEAVCRSGVCAVNVAPEPLASAVGAGLDISSPYAQMLVDIGGGVTDVAVIRSRRLVQSRALRKACGDLHSAVQRAVAKKRKVAILQREAERLVCATGAGAAAGSAPLAARGVDRRGCEVELQISPLEVSEAIQPVIADIVGTVRQAVQSLSPDMAVEVLESGICLTGGGACLRGMDDLIASGTSLHVNVASNPLHATINGASQMLAVSAQAGVW